jgi:hypothetical protein
MDSYGIFIMWNIWGASMGNRFFGIDEGKTPTLTSMDLMEVTASLDVRLGAYFGHLGPWKLHCFFRMWRLKLGVGYTDTLITGIYIKQTSQDSLLIEGL